MKETVLPYFFAYYTSGTLSTLESAVNQLHAASPTVIPISPAFTTVSHEYGMARIDPIFATNP